MINEDVVKTSVPHVDLSCHDVLRATRGFRTFASENACSVNLVSVEIEKSGQCRTSERASAQCDVRKLRTVSSQPDTLHVKGALVGELDLELKRLSDVHRADLDMQALIAKLGAGFRYVGPNLERHLWCSRCGEKAVSIQIHYLNSARSRFAD